MRHQEPKQQMLIQNDNFEGRSATLLQMNNNLFENTSNTIRNRTDLTQKGFSEQNQNVNTPQFLSIK